MSVHIQIYNVHAQCVGLCHVVGRGHSTTAAALYTATQIFENMVSKPAPHMCIPPPQRVHLKMLKKHWFFNGFSIRQHDRDGGTYL